MPLLSFPSGTTCTLKEGTQNTLTRKTRYLGTKNLSNCPKVSATVFFKTDYEVSTFANWYINATDYGYYQFQMDLNFFGTPKDYLVKIRNDITETLKEGTQRTINIELDIVEDIGAVFAPGVLVNAFNSIWSVQEGEIINLPLVQGYNYDFIVDYGDGTQKTVTEWDSVNASHLYTASGIYTVTISGLCEAWDSSQL